MNNGASRPPAVTGSITNDNSGMPTIENPPPNAPFMKQIRNTPAKAIRTVVSVNSMAPLHDGQVSQRASAHGVDRGVQSGWCSQNDPTFVSVQVKHCTRFNLDRPLGSASGGIE